jgi:hypothetical protein
LYKEEPPIEKSNLNRWTAKIYKNILVKNGVVLTLKQSIGTQFCDKGIFHIKEIFFGEKKVVLTLLALNFVTRVRTAVFIRIFVFMKKRLS